MDPSDAQTPDPERAHRVKQLEAENAELLRRLEAGEVIHTLGLAANRSLDPDEVLGLVARVTRTALGAAYVTVSTEDNGEVRTLASIGLEGDEITHDPLAARVVREGKLVRVDDADADSLPEHRREGMRAALGVPLSLYGETFGALVIAYRRPFEVAGGDVRIAASLAGHAAVAISNARLHHALRDRSAMLQRAYEEVRDGAEAKERFFASLSHEIRTPLNAILGYHSLIADGIVGEIPEQVGDFLANAQRAAEGLLHLVRDVLDLSKIEAGKVTLDLRPISVHDVVRDAIASVQPLAERKSLPIRIGDAEPAPLVVTDRDGVRQILVNLLSNAVKFTQSGEITVDVLARSMDGSEGAAETGVSVAVRDTGPGIDPADHDRIFREFEQVQGAGARGGTGLGLPISRKLARLLGGDLTLDSAPGRGSSFTLTLPLRTISESGTSIATGD